MPNLRNLTGLSFGRLTVLKRGPNLNKRVRWVCKCVCGRLTIVNAWNLENGHTTSCGCLKMEAIVKAKTTHGLTDHKLYQRYNQMVSRVTDPENPDYEHYGGRGIKICERWLGDNGLQNFITDMYPTFSEGMTIDRIDTNGNYQPDNCRWLSQADQNRNRRESHNLTDSPTWTSWWAVIKSKKYDPRWAKFQNFLEDMGYRPKHSILKRRNPRLAWTRDNAYWKKRKKGANNE